jgi:hypothetical protein
MYRKTDSSSYTDNLDEIIIDCSSESDSNDESIPKPVGEPGRPNRGGYNLQSAINLDGTTYRKLKVNLQSLLEKIADRVKNAVHRLIKQHLDEGKSYSKQDPIKIDVICKEVKSTLFFCLSL